MLQETGAPTAGITDANLGALMQHIYGVLQKAQAAQASPDGNGDAAKRSKPSAKERSKPSAKEEERHQAVQASTMAATTTIAQQLAAGGTDTRNRSRSPKRQPGDHACQLVDTAAETVQSPAAEVQDEEMREPQEE